MERATTAVFRFERGPENLRNKPQLVLGLALVLAASLWFYVQRVLIPHQQAQAAALDQPRGNLSDLYPRWLGARELLLRHRDPYSPEITREIQIGYYGRALDPSRPNDPKDQQGFAYPLYVVFPLAPSIGLPFDVVQAAFRWFLAIFTGATVFLWLHALNWRPAATTAAVFLILTMGSFPVAQGLKLQQLSLLVSGLMAGGVALLVSGHLLAAGGLLALATIKPQLTLPLVGWLALWATGDWRRRQRLLWGFGLTMAILLLGSQWLFPGWITAFRGAIKGYRQYTGGSLLDLLITPGWGAAFTLLVLMGLAALGWRQRRQSANTHAFALTLSLVQAVTVVVVPTFASYNQLLLLPGIFLLARSWPALWENNRISHLACGIAAALLVWPWMAAMGLMLASPFLPPTTLQGAWALPLYTSLGMPLAVLALLTLLATRMGVRPL